MGRNFVFDLVGIRHLLGALRNTTKSDENAFTNSNTDEGYRTTQCLLMRQMAGPLSKLECFQRDSSYIRGEIAFEEKYGEVKNLDCQMEIKGEGESKVACNKPCRMKYCTDCWKDLLAEIHGQPGHVCRVKVKDEAALKQEKFNKAYNNLADQHTMD